MIQNDFKTVQSPSPTTGENTKYIVLAIVAFVVFCIALAIVYKIYSDRKNTPPAAGIVDSNNTNTLEEKIASLSAETKFLSYNVSTNALDIKKLLVDLNSIKNISLAPSSDIAILRKDVSNFAVSQSALYSQLKKWANTDYLSSAIAILLNRVDTRAQNEKQMISVDANAQQVAPNSDVVFNDPSYNSNSILGDIVIKDAKTFVLKPGAYFFTVVVSSDDTEIGSSSNGSTSSFSFVSVEDGSIVDGSELNTPFFTSTAFVLEIPKDTGEYKFSMRNQGRTNANITKASVIIFTL